MTITNVAKRLAANPYLLIILMSLGVSACGSNGSSSSAPVAAATSIPAYEQPILKNFTVVTDDQSFMHGRAWRDASGVVWSQTTMTKVTAVNAENTCNMLGATLPTPEQLDQLARYLGRDSTVGFHPEYMQGMPGMSVFWKLGHTNFWSKVTSPMPPTVPCLNGKTGTIQNVSVTNASTGNAALGGTLCVFPEERPTITCGLTTGSVCKPVIVSKGPVEYQMNSTDGAVSIQVGMSVVNAQGSSTMTFKMTDNANHLSTMKTNPVAGGDSLSNSIDVTTANGTNYTLTCQAQGYQLSHSLDPCP